jgi:hypothetical protein
MAIDAWTTSGITEGPVFRSVSRGGAVRDTALSEKLVWQLIRPYAEAAGVAGIAPMMPPHMREIVPGGGRRV